MKLLGWLRKQQHDASVAKVDTRLQTLQIHEVEKHVENLQLRSRRVAREVEKRQLGDPWGQTVAGIARHSR